MNIITTILATIGAFCISIISSIGYFGVFFLMTLESMIFPMPSELVMPFAGFLIASGEMKFLFVVLAATLGSIVGSLLSYYLGRYGGNRFVLKYGKYFLLNEEHLRDTERWFSKKGELTILIGRFIPIVRHVISIPAGIGKMDIKKFMLYTIIGAGIWNAFLTYVGLVLGNNWEKIQQYSDYASFAVLIILGIIIGYFILRHIRKKKRIKSKN
jgi:membrane protein DedA with SNARE-associated domain